MAWRLLSLPRHRSLSTAALSTTAREIAALIAAGDSGASVKRAKQFLLFEAAGASEVPSLYRAVVSVSAAAPRGKPSDHLSAAASALVEASVRAALPDGALRLLEDLIDTPGAPLPSGPSCDLLMEKLLALRCHAHVRRVFGILAAAGERPGAAAWNCVVQACAMEGDLDEALLKLRRMGGDGGAPAGEGPDARTCAAVITALWMGGRGADAVKVFGEMADMGVASDPSTFNAMLCGYLKTGDLEAASELRTRMMREGVDLYLHKHSRPALWKLYAAMIEGYLKTGDLVAASELRSVMKQVGMELSKKQQRMFQILDGARNGDAIIEICIMANDMEEAIRRLRSKARPDDADLCKMVIAALWRAGRVADAVEVFGEMADMGVEPNHSTYNAMVGVYLKTGDLNAALELRIRMMQKGMKLPRKLLCMLQTLAEDMLDAMVDGPADGCLKTGYRKSASELLSRVMRNKVLQWTELGMTLYEEEWHTLQILAKAVGRPGDFSRNKVIEVCIKAGDVTEAIRRLRHKGNDGMARPNATSYTMVIGALWDAKRGDEAVKLFNEMADMDVVPDDRTYNVMIRGHLERLRSGAVTPKKNEKGVIWRLHWS